MEQSCLPKSQECSTGIFSQHTVETWGSLECGGENLEITPYSSELYMSHFNNSSGIACEMKYLDTELPVLLGGKFYWKCKLKELCFNLSLSPL